MSEYQYYEFMAIDKPLSKEDKTEIGSWSSRTNPSNTGATFTYSYGSFPKDVITVTEKYFDAMFSVSNWGTTRLIFKFPTSLLTTNRIRQYCSENGLEIIKKSDFILLDIGYSEEEGGGNWIEGEGWLSSIISLRNDIINKDYRCLYLIWLKDAISSFESDLGDSNSDDYEPQVPDGLNDLNDALQDFVDIFQINKDYITAAAENSKPQNPDRQIDLATYLDQLSENERREFLVRLLNDEPLLHIKLKSRLKEFLDTNETSMKDAPRRTIEEIMQKVEEIREQRINREQKEREEKQLKKLRTIEGQEFESWTKVQQLISEKTPKAYDQAILLLQDLKELSIYKNRFNDFCEKIELIKEKYSRLSGLTSRIKDAKLIKLPLI